MRGMITVIRPLMAIAAVAFAAGCFPTPNLTVSPGAISLGVNDDSATVRILNTGSGVLTWTVSEDLPWLSLVEVDKQTDSVSGTVTTQIAVVELVVDRTSLPIGTTQGEITVTSNGGTAVVPVSVSQAGPAVLVVDQTQLNFGATSTQSNLIISNSGLEPLVWELSVPASAPWLKATPKTGTIATAGVNNSVTITVNREALAAGDYSATLNITSNGGNAQVDVTLSVVPFGVSPEVITFGTIAAAESDNLVITNSGASGITLSFNATTTSGGAWLSVSQNSANVPAAGQTVIGVEADPAGLAPGSYAGNIAVSNAAAGYSIDVPVTMSVTGIDISPTTIDFGTITGTTTRTFTVTNLSTAPQTYGVDVPATDGFWLSVAPEQATVSSAPVTHTLTVDPANLEPGAYTSNVTVDFGSGSETVQVRVARPRPARLVVVSNNIIFGTRTSPEVIDIYNDGIGTVNWSIDTSGFPAWLRIAEAAGGSVGGTVSGEATDSITLIVDRSLAPADAFDFSFSFNVAATGDFTGNVPVSVSMTVPRIPQIELEADGIDSTGTPFLNFDVGQTSKTFIIRNNGNGTLTWNFTGQVIPPWITSIQPIQSSLNPGTEQQVTMSVDRTGLSFVGAQVELQLFNNAPASLGGSIPLNVEIQVPKTIAIGTRPATLAFGENASIGILEIANVGDPETILNYQVTSNKEWLAVFPETGQSIGTASTIKDYRPHTVTVDRARLDGAGAAAKLTVTAFQIIGGQRVPLESVAPVEVPVSVEASQLTIENGPPRVRVPSMVRFVLLMRNLQYAPIKLQSARLATLAQQIQIFENDREQENSETAQIIKPGVEKGNLLVLLDYSNSMQESARAVSDAAIAGAADPIQALYERCITPLLDEVPANYRVGIAVFSERTGNLPLTDALRPLYGTAAEGPETENEIFLADRDLLKARLAELVVGTNGATELLPALRDAGSLVAEEDAIAGIFPFDDADDRIIVCVTDGRLTTPPGTITTTTEFLSTVARTRFWGIGWGEGVASAPLVQLAVETGGHNYATRTEPTGEVDAFGTAIRIPVVDELLDWCVSDPADECDLSISRDIDAQYTFSYVSLTEESADIEGRLTFDDPNDQDSPCLSEQGEISGTFGASQVPLPLVANDTSLAQIRLKNLGLRGDGTATIEMYLDYAPRGVRSFSFDLSTSGAAALIRGNVRQVARIQGGLIGSWIPGGSGSIFTYTAPSDEPPLTYGDFGPLLTIEVAGVANPDALLNLDVLNPVYASSDPDSRYVSYPDTIRLATGEFLATSLPRPDIELIEVNDTPVINESDYLFYDSFNQLVLDLGTDVNCFTLRFHNRGGAHLPTNVLLRYFPTINTDGLVTPTRDVPGCTGESTDLLVWNNIRVGSTQAPVDRKFYVSRTTSAGIIDGRNDGIDDVAFELEFDYLLTGINYTGTIDPIFLRMEVLPPVLNVAPLAIDFGLAVNQSTLTVANDGQGLMFWDIANFIDFPSWLIPSEISGALENGKSQNIVLAIDRAAVPSGVTNFPITVRQGEGDSIQTAVVNVSVTGP
ncbi:MAG: hypothetical protein GC168_06945 [Candidatus Hydrogenedens sp.]|nr:hypothetical protein [Candidatus Hydrogenedens sp.]